MAKGKGKGKTVKTVKTSSGPPQSGSNPYGKPAPAPGSKKGK